MSSRRPSSHVRALSDASEAPAPLAERLPPDQLACLARQGFVQTERRPSGRVGYKLRYRDQQRRQRVVSLGSDPNYAAAVAAELARLQSGRRLQEALARQVRAVNAALRRSRRRWAPALAAHGYYFHGRILRRRRRIDRPSARRGDDCSPCVRHPAAGGEPRSAAPAPKYDFGWTRRRRTRAELKTNCGGAANRLRGSARPVGGPPRKSAQRQRRIDVLMPTGAGCARLRSPPSISR